MIASILFLQKSNGIMNALFPKIISKPIESGICRRSQAFVKFKIKKTFRNVSYIATL